MQGEVQERELEAILRSQFPSDEFEAVAIGRLGGDLIQKVIGIGGMVCGTMPWEFKRTRSWQKDWLVKVRENQRNVRATLGVIVSTALPKGLVSFDRLEDVWVSALDCIVPLCEALRFTLYQTSVLSDAGLDGHDASSGNGWRQQSNRRSDSRKCLLKSLPASLLTH